MRHPLADLLIHAAENADARFTVRGCDVEYTDDILGVLLRPNMDWAIKPKFIVKKWHFAYRMFDCGNWCISSSPYGSEEAFRAQMLVPVYDVTKLEFTEIMERG